jgi:hypothetical protein
MSSKTTKITKEDTQGCILRERRELRGHREGFRFVSSDFQTSHFDLSTNVLRYSARGQDRQEGDQGHRRLQPDRGRRSGDGRSLRREGQLGADADPRRPATAGADRVLARRRHRRLGVRRLPPRPHLADVRGPWLGVQDRPHRDRRDHRGAPLLGMLAIVLWRRRSPPRRPG